MGKRYTYAILAVLIALVTSVVLASASVPAAPTFTSPFTLHGSTPVPDGVAPRGTVAFSRVRYEPPLAQPTSLSGALQFTAGKYSGFLENEVQSHYRLPSGEKRHVTFEVVLWMDNGDTIMELFICEAISCPSTWAVRKFGAEALYRKVNWYMEFHSGTPSYVHYQMWFTNTSGQTVTVFHSDYYIASPSIGDFNLVTHSYEFWHPADWPTVAYAEYVTWNGQPFSYHGFGNVNFENDALLPKQAVTAGWVKTKFWPVVAPCRVHLPVVGRNW